ncbi:sulfatase-like hydrolase/transferase [Pontiella sp.]|uniref:sulfatase-like hydrolase/transferase n=1 Tax=Pontiella sp. TaxID=2837462 RepID=UPI0035678904
MKTRQTVFALVLLAASMQVAAASEKLNICFFLADDLRADGIGALGGQIVKTPHIDKLCERGFAFRNAYTLGSDRGGVCVPSRAMIASGRSYLRPDVQAILKGGAKYRRPETETPLLGQTLATAGYASIRSGKFGSNPNQVDQYYDVHIDGKTAEGNADNLIAFIQKNAGQKPLFLYMAPHEPHDPQFSPKSYHALYKAADIPMPVNFLPMHPFDNGEMLVRDEQTLPWPRTPESVGGKRAKYYASVTYLDDQIGRVVDALKQAGQFENTIFIVAGDNGLSLGEHGLIGKQNVYELGGMEVPLVFAGPGIAQGESESFAYLYDVYPTMCELAGIPVPDGLDAKSLVPVINGTQPKVRDVLFTAYRDCQRAIRDERWKLARYPLIDKTQLFDLQSDPHEMNDLAANPEYAGKIKELTALLETTRRAMGDTDALTVANPGKAEWSVPDKIPTWKEQVKAREKAAQQKQRRLEEKTKGEKQ